MWDLFGNVWGKSMRDCSGCVWESRWDSFGDVWGTAGGTSLEMCGDSRCTFFGDVSGDIRWDFVGDVLG